MMMKQKDKAILSSRPVRPMTQRGARRRPIPKKRGKQTSGRRRGRRLYGDYTLQSERIKPSFFSALLFTDNETYRGENALRRTRRTTKKNARGNDRPTPRTTEQTPRPQNDPDDGTTTRPHNAAGDETTPRGRLRDHSAEKTRPNVARRA